MSPVGLARAAVACLLVGGGLLVLLDHPATLAAGVALLAAFIALGALAILNPADLAEDPGPDD